ncbi:unnamed protein product [Calypogeia fissa]
MLVAPAPPLAVEAATPRVAEVPKASPMIEQEEEAVAQIVRSLKELNAPDLNGDAPKEFNAVPSIDSPGKQFKMVIPHRPRKPVFNRVYSLESGEILEEPANGGQECNHDAVPMEEDEEDRPRKLQDDINSVNGVIPKYIKESLLAEHRWDMDGMIEELGRISKRAFCEDLAAGTLETYKDYMDAMFKYLPWLARKVVEQKAEIAKLKSRIEDMANSADYDHLLKEKSNWTSTKKQLEDDLLEATNATNQAV